MLQNLLASDRVIEFAERESVASAGRRKGLKTELLEQSGRPDIPRIRDDESALALMERGKNISFFGLCRHQRSAFHYNPVTRRPELP